MSDAGRYGTPANGNSGDSYTLTTEDVLGIVQHEDFIACAYFRGMDDDKALARKPLVEASFRRWLAGVIADAKAEGAAGKGRELLQLANSIVVLRGRAERAEAKLAAVRADMHLTMMTPDPHDPGAYVLGRDAETALTEGEQEEGTRWMPTR